MLALLAGAGGSALLELLWRPRRDRRRAAALLLAEVALNTELVLLQAHARQRNPYGILADFNMSTIAWQAGADLVTELPVRLLRQLVILYNQYERLNRNVAAFAESLDTYSKAEAGSPAYTDADTMCARILDVFNTGLDATLKRGQELLPQLADLAKLKETNEENANFPNYGQVASDVMQARKQHLEAMLRARKREDNS